MKHPIILIMGVAGAGKASIGKALAEAIDATFLDADEYLSRENIAYMATRKPLSDAMRWPFLDAVADGVKAAANTQKTVFACSALKRIYRDYLRASFSFTLVYPEAPLALVQARIAALGQKPMPANLLRRQYDTLSIPTKDEAPIIVSIDQPIADIVLEIQTQLD